MSAGAPPVKHEPKVATRAQQICTKVSLYFGDCIDEIKLLKKIKVHDKMHVSHNCWTKKQKCSVISI